MKSQSLEEMLVDTPETKAEVSPELHQNIMRAVRLATPHDRTKSPGWRVLGWKVPDWMGSGWKVPAWGAGVAMLALTIFYLAQTAPGFSSPGKLAPGVSALEIPEPGVSRQSVSLVQTQKPAQKISLMSLGDKLAAFSEDTLLPEKELMEEFEHLKSDLKRLGFRS